MTFVVREHYVPKFLLNLFADDDGKLWIYDTAHANWFQSSPTTAGIEKNIYDQKVEKWLSQEIELPVSSIFRDLDDGKDNFSEDKLFLIAKFVAIQRVRVRAIEKIAESSHQNLVYDKLLETLDELGLAMSSNLLCRAKDDPKEFLETIGLHSLCNLALRGAMCDENFEIAESMVQMAWRVIRPENNRYIVTDNPVVIDVSDEGNELPECVLPISKTCAIHIGLYGNAGTINETIIDDRLVETLNLRILAASNRFVFASRKEDWISRNAHAKLPSQPHLTFGAEFIPDSY